MIIYKKGDALVGQEMFLLHGCNCFCTMGAGIARQIANRWPGAEEEDNKTKSGDPEKIGTFSTHWTGNKLIINAYTQFSVSSGNDVFEYTGWKWILESLSKHLIWDTPVAMPLIGAGLARGSWPAIAALMDHVAPNVTFHVYILPSEWDKYYGIIQQYPGPLRAGVNDGPDSRPATANRGQEGGLQDNHGE